MVFYDDGKPFDPTNYDIEKPFEELDTGGMGIGLVKSTVDEFRYERLEERNIITLVFNRPKEI